jgi:hypothetical protein
MQNLLVRESENDRVLEGERELVAEILAGNHERYYELIAPIERRVYYTAYAILRTEAEILMCWWKLQNVSRCAVAVPRIAF